MSEREYEARCSVCANRWYLRLRSMPSEVRVRCPRCNYAGALAVELPPVDVGAPDPKGKT